MSSSTTPKNTTTSPKTTAHKQPAVMEESADEMYVIKRNGKLEPIKFDKILNRLKKLCFPDLHLNTASIAMKIIDQLFNKIDSKRIDDLAAELCFSMSSIHTHFSVLAARIVHSNHHKNTTESFSAVMSQLHKFTDKQGKSAPLISDELYAVVKKNKKELDAMCDYSLDLLIDYFGFKTLEKSYLMRINGKIVERIQHMWLRVGLSIHLNDLDKVRESYLLMGNKRFTHATPTLFNAGTRHQQLSSCFLLELEEDSLEGIFNTLQDCAKISKWGGGIGLSISNLRSDGSLIRGTNGKSTGVVPMLKVFNYTAKLINQGGKRNGSYAIYLELFHADISMFLQMKKNHGDEELKARDLFFAVWVSDLFMERVQANAKWTLMCPDECPGLSDVWGDEFKVLYERYEQEGKGRETINARDLWIEILDSQMETGTPYILYKDACNRKSNQQNLGTIKSSNLCVAPETLVLTELGETAISGLAGQKIKVWNGHEFSEVEITKTGEDQELIDVYTNNSKKLSCTLYHKFFVQRSAELVEKVEAQDLKIGDELIAFKYPDIQIRFDGKPITENPMIKHTITRIKRNGRRDDTYCFNEPLRNAGVFNGILTGNCSEIIEFSSSEESAVCNLASIGLPTFLIPQEQTFCIDYEKLHEVSKVITYNLNKVIDVNYYPTEKTKLSNMRHRPIGIGVQGLADLFMMMKLPFDSEQARKINRDLFETIYHGALEMSCEMARDTGAYETFAGSPASKGILQFDMWDYDPTNARYDWTKMKENVVQHGLKNSLLIALMPTCSTSSILGFTECFEPITSNIYSRSSMAGNFLVANKHLMKTLQDLGLWNEAVKNNIILNNGSVQQIDIIPQEVRDVYKTAWEMDMKSVVDMSADRGVFVCQSQSLNLWVMQPNYKTLTNLYFQGWKRGLKTSVYYLRRRAAAAVQQFSIQSEKSGIVNNEEHEEICEMCSA